MDFTVTQCSACPFISIEQREGTHYCILHDILTRDSNSQGLWIHDRNQLPPEECKLRDGPARVVLARNLIKRGCRKCGRPTPLGYCSECKREKKIR